MQPCNDTGAGLRSLLRALCLAAVLAPLACAGSGRTGAAKLEVQGDGGFTITESARLSGSVREDFERGVQALRVGNTAEGIALLEQVTGAAPELTAAHIDLGMAYARADDLERAEASLERARDLSPGHPVVHNELGIVYRKSGRFEEARRSYERALALYPGFHFARRNLAILCDLYLAEPGCALENYRLYVEAVPDDAAVAMWIADLENRAGR